MNTYENLTVTSDILNLPMVLNFLFFFRVEVLHKNAGCY